MQITRTIPALPRPLDPITGPAAPLVLYAAVVDRHGCVVAWTNDTKLAENFPPTTVARVRDYYADRPEFGVTALEPEPPAAEPTAPAPQTPEQPKASRKGRRTRVEESADGR